MGGLSWVVADMLWNRTLKISLYGFCNGVVSGLVTITPASGFVTPASSLAFGGLGKLKLETKKNVKNQI